MPINILKTDDKFKPTVAFDFDGVIAEYDGWKGEDVFGAPRADIIDVMKRIKSEGFRIIIFTTRKLTEKMRAYLAENGIPFDEFVGEKPFYTAFIDDRTINNVYSADVYVDIKRVIGDAK